MMKIINMPSTDLFLLNSLYIINEFSEKTKAVYPILYQYAITPSINSILKDNIILSYHSTNIIQWKTGIIYNWRGGDPNNVFINSLRRKIKNGIIRKYINKKEEIKFYKNYERIFNILNHKRYNKINSHNDYLLSLMIHNKPHEALKYIQNLLNGHSIYFHCKYLEYIYKKWYITILNNNHKNRNYYLQITNIYKNVPYFDMKKDKYISNKFENFKLIYPNDIRIQYKYCNMKRNSMLLKREIPFLKALTILHAKILTFSFKGVLFKLFPPLFNPLVGNHDYTDSLFVKQDGIYKPLHSLSIDSKEYKTWCSTGIELTPKEKQFKTDLLLLMDSKNTNKNVFTGILLDHLYKIETTDNYIQFYRVVFQKENEDKENFYYCTEYSRRRAINKGWYTKHYLKGEVKEAHSHGYTDKSIYGKIQRTREQKIKDNICT